ncbi:MAG TPA: hypothetical protein VF402_07340 [Asticcacaulis sp.]
MPTLRAAALPSRNPAFGAFRGLAARRPLLVAAAALLLWTLLIRLPFLHVIHDDEAFYAVVAQRWLRGEWPYAASYDVKAPGVFAVLAAVQAVFGAHLAVIKGVEIAFTAWGALALYRLLRPVAGPVCAGIAAGAYPLYSLFMLGVAAPCQLIEAAFTIEAFALALAADRAGRRRLVLMALSGLMMGCAVMTKQTAAFTALGLFGWAAWRSRARRDLLPLALFCAAGLLPALGFAVCFLACGHVRDAFDAVVVNALSRSQTNMSRPSPLGVLQRVAQFPAFLKPILVISVGTLLALLRLPRLRAAVGGAPLSLLLVWSLSEALGILACRSPDIWYGFVLIPPFLALAAIVLRHGVAFRPDQRAAWIGAYLLAAAAQPFLVPDAIAPSSLADYTGSVRAAGALRMAGLKPGDNLLVTGRGHYAYLMTGALPKAKYFNAMHLMCAFPTPDADPLAAAFATRPDFVLVSDLEFYISCQRPDRAAALNAELAAHYQAVSHVSGRWDSFTVYRRRDP